MRELLLGVELALGGRRSRIRALLTAGGVAVGVALLLVAASAPNLVGRAQDRSDARQPTDYVDRVTDAPLAYLSSDTTFEGRSVHGMTLQALRRDAPAPPGLTRLPGTDELAVSPALRRLLRQQGPDGLLARRLGGRVVATIAPAGLTGPQELAFVRGSDTLLARWKRERTSSGGTQILGVGGFGPRTSGDGGSDPFFTLLAIVIGVALLLPIAVFLATAARFGGEERDRRLATVRLVGAGGAATARVAAGEGLVAALAGTLAGAALFAVGHPLLGGHDIAGISVFADDIQPDPALAVLVLLAVPLVAVGATLTALRSVVIEPLGVSRRARPPERRMPWRLGVPLLGFLLLLPFVGDSTRLNTGMGQLQAIAGVLFVLSGLVTLLPWCVERLAALVDGRGPLSLQLALRRLRIDGGTGGRVVAGIGVTVAGAIALQTTFADANGTLGRATDRLGVDMAVRGVVATPAAGAALGTQLRATPGVRSAVVVRDVRVRTTYGRTRGDFTAAVASCADVAMAAGLPVPCRDGDVIRTPLMPPDVPQDAVLRLGGGRRTVAVRANREAPTVVSGVPLAQAYVGAPQVIVTPGALRGRAVDGSSTVLVRFADDPGSAVDRVRTLIGEVDPLAQADLLTTIAEPAELRTLRRVLLAGAALVLTLIGVSLLLASVEQLRERRRVLAVLTAFGTRRRTVAASVVWQTALPVAVGTVLAVGVGLALARVLLAIGHQPMTPDWGGVAALSGIGAGVVAGVTLLSLPVVARMMRPDGLRAE